jgi:NAD(P)-dependent dehydrogenase (short-subunit alcohol dehydrogenase family)/acetyltransferase-like isoleucine patch superfamily enzyme
MANCFTIEELRKKGVTVYGKNIQVSSFVNIYNPSNLTLHDNIRIDDFTIMSCKGKVEIFNHVHIGSQCMINSSTNIIFGNYSGISSGVKLFGGCDDYSGNFLTNPTIPSKYLNVQIGDIILEDHVIVGASTVILPNVVLKEGTSVGALSLVKKSTEPWKMYCGTPLKLIKDRNDKCLVLQKELESEKQNILYSCTCESSTKNANTNDKVSITNYVNNVLPTNNDITNINCENKTIFITGGSKGIGKSIALHFKKLNYNVIITFNNSLDEALELEKQGIYIYKMNVTNFEECKYTIESIINKFKKIDVLVNNAGILENKLFHEMTYHQWCNVINTNLTSLYNVTHNVIQNMLENKNGKIINISSIFGIKGSKGQSNYSSSKHAVVGFTKSLALEYGSSNIQVNCICPGLVDTEMTQQLVSEKIRDKIIQSLPIKKIIDPIEVAKTCEFLVNTEYCTGTIINIDCGMNC